MRKGCPLQAGQTRRVIMSDEVFEDLGDLSPPPPETDGELVHWGARKPLRVGPAGISATAGAAFSLGVVVTLGVLALVGWIGPQRELAIPTRRM